MTLNNIKKIVFENKNDKDFNDIILEILKNNGLEETLDDSFKKAQSGKEPWEKILYTLSKNFFSGILNEETFLSSIQNQLQVSSQVAINILKEIKEKLLPMARTLEKDELIEDSTISYEPLKLSNKQTKSPKINSQKKGDKEISKLQAPLPPAQDTKKSNILTEIPEIKKDITEQQQNKNDAYREPL